MGFQPIVIGTGLVAWRNLQRTYAGQIENFSKRPEKKRLVDEFLGQAQSIKTSQDLTRKRDLLTVALSAFGLQDDLPNTFFINKVLNEGTQSPKALANKLTDSRYRRLADTFGFDRLTATLGVQSRKAERIAQDFVREAFAVEVGRDHPSLRLALGAERELDRIAKMDVSDNARWFLVMGNPPLRKVVETAFNLPSSLGRLELDQQLDIFKEKYRVQFGDADLKSVTEGGRISTIIDQFLLKEQLKNSTSQLSSNNIALTLLSG